MATLKDIASRAKVSVATVSKFLNSKGSFSSTTEEKIREAIDFYNYHHKIRSSISDNNSNTLVKTVGLIIPDVENPFFSSITKTLELLLFRYGYFLILCNSDNNLDLENNFFHYLTNKAVNGIILITTNSIERKIQQTSGIPLVLLDRKIDNLKISYVATDNKKGTKAATTYLIEINKNKIAFIGGRDDLNTSQERLNGYLEALKEFSIPVDEEIIVKGDFSFQGGYQAMSRLLLSGKPFDSVLTGNDIEAFGAIECLREAGITVPDQVSIVGYDDIWLSKISHPKLTTLHQPVFELCREAVNILLQSMKNPSIVVQRILEPELVIRESCKPGKKFF
jgi:DNA-binding LacI/PurR family transcriptional regulator